MCRCQPQRHADAAAAVDTNRTKRFSPPHEIGRYHKASAAAFRQAGSETLG